MQEMAHQAGLPEKRDCIVCLTVIAFVYSPLLLLFTAALLMASS